MMKCVTPGCERPVKVKARGLCGTCYERLMAYDVPKLNKRQTKYCSIQDCSNKRYARSWCRAHYMRWISRGTTDRWVPTPRQLAPCSVEGCGRLEKAAGWCTAHYSRQYVHGDVGSPEIRPIRANGVIGYSQARRRLNGIRGYAREYPCAECGRDATGYELQPTARVHREPTGQYAGLPYSDDPNDYYPLCRKHRKERKTGNL